MIITIMKSCIYTVNLALVRKAHGLCLPDRPIAGGSLIANEQIKTGAGIISRVLSAILAGVKHPLTINGPAKLPAGHASNSDMIIRLFKEPGFTGFVCCFFAALSCCAQVRLPKLVSNGMVLQRDAVINVWGWASAGEKVAVKFKGAAYHTVADQNGKWAVKMKPSKAGGPYKLEITATNHIVLDDVMTGDVWFCSGQSNMVLNMERVKEKYPEEIASADYPDIRNFFIPTVSNVLSVKDDLPDGRWVSASPQNVLSFGAASYFFARGLYERYHVPIGIINSSVGGTPIQAWISEDGIKNIMPYSDRVKQFKVPGFGTADLQVRQPVNTRPAEKDKGMIAEKRWYDNAYSPQGWHHFWLPGYWADQGIKGLNGVVWFRKEIDVPAEMAGKAAKLYMGRIVDADFLYVNGSLVGSTSYQYPPRRYEVPAGLLRAGKNLIVVRVINTAGKGGFVPEKPYFLTDGQQRIDLRGDWLYKVGEVYPPVSQAPPAFSAQNEPTGLYNTMVAPVLNYNIKGALWYQGESNTAKPAEYAPLLKALIADWRTKWKAPDMPFIYAQLPNFNEVQYLPGESQWAELRESQFKALSVPNTGMAVTIDAGEWNDIHPLDKKTVGSRLALAARKVAYHEKDLISSGPVFKSASVEGDKIIIRFESAGSGLVAKDGTELEHFAIAGEDKKFIWAKADIVGDSVIVSSPSVAKPLFVRYAWADNPENANLYNKEGLPASPFRTDK